MLFITIQFGESKKTYQWHVGEEKQKLIFKENALAVIQVQADLDELAYILSKFRNIPHVANSRVEVWYGDFAKFIAANL